MYVCSCFAVTDSEIEQVLDAGARSVAEVTRACRAGGDCGACHGQIAELLADREADLVPCGALGRKFCAA
ncbi:MAG: (2Fe-2S)-binding protein [Myxococcales bacterium]|nr:(2Fe-2S)-binding protein [Myxococcales bacterium]MBL0193951.1 (2Fe-2S)-binding protein [Myxococcales bacterium]